MTVSRNQANPSAPFPRSVHPDVARLLTIDPVSGCWLWGGMTDEKGYGVRVYPVRGSAWFGRVERVHRLVYRWCGRTIPDGYDLDHECRVRRCANPAHLTPLEHAAHGALSATDTRTAANLAAWDQERRST